MEASLVPRAVRPLYIPAGGGASFAVGGLRFRLLSELSRGALRLPWSYRPFAAAAGADVDLRVRVGSRPRLERLAAPVVFDSGLHWRALAPPDSVCFELFHPPTRSLYCRATLEGDFSSVDVVFSETAWGGLHALAAGDEAEYCLPHPLDELLLTPALALHGSVLLHASGAVLGERALVFVGHSGEGKTTLARLLENEGLSLLSDERVVVRWTESGAVAHGTPWPGEGNVVSERMLPLGGLFVIEKAAEHAVVPAFRGSLAAEVLARAIVPCYLPLVTARVMETLGDVLSRVPSGGLRFERKVGLPEILASVVGEGADGPPA